MPTPSAHECESLSERIFDDVVERIRRCSIKPGQLLLQAQLAEHYGVSKTPVREALQRLVEKRLVEKYSRAGYIVTQITAKDIQEGYQMRRLLEGEAAYHAAVQITEKEISELESLLIPEHVDQGSANRAFHLGIARASRNGRLINVSNQIHDDMDRLSMLDPYLAKWSALGIAEHQNILDALRQRNPDSARVAAWHHAEAGLARVLRSVQTPQEVIMSTLMR